MLRGYRLIIVAFGLILASPSHGQEVKPDQGQPGKDAGNQLERIAAAFEKISIAAAPDRGCDPTKDDRQSDLCAQWKAADSAAQSARWSLFMLWVSGLGLLVGGGTLFAAWRAAHWAKKAADFTEAGAESAKDAVGETRRIGEAQVRAYVRICDVTVIRKPDHIQVHPVLHNSGQSPATVIEIMCRVHNGADEKFSDHWTGHDVVGSGEKSELAPFFFNMTHEECGTLLISTVVKFRDVFGHIKRQRAHFAGPSRWGEGGRGEGFAPRDHIRRALLMVDKYSSTSNGDSRQHGQ